ncbi:MAG TPA: glycogen debranching N-terminal domain-containing protein, partial [Myxococcota bacterium]|nr:glycogen debranching N-terminal domain-containing protein [Myxococcota bacterium]
AGDAFGVFDRYGDVHAFRAARHGVFLAGARHLSRFVLNVGSSRPLLLGSYVRDDNRSLQVDVTNPDPPADSPEAPIRNALYLRRSQVLGDSGCRIDLAVKSYAPQPVEMQLGIQFAADFIDVFELRGARRQRRGSLVKSVRGAGVDLEYEGLDRARRATRFRFDPSPDALSDNSAEYRFTLEPGEERSIRVDLAFSSEAPVEAELRKPSAGVGSAHPPALFGCRAASSNPAFDDWLDRSRSDLAMMLTPTPWGPYPYAGVPWFSTPFGRDGLITALSTLWIEPAIARGVLRFLAAHQATQQLPEVDAEPGKILHEMRAGEMAALGEIPFGRYYGSVDATPLFLILAAEYHTRTGDLGLVREILPNLEAALEWMDRYGDRDGDGFIEYERRSSEGLTNHGWKDSYDSISHRDGALARGSIATCEVQAYAYAARRGLGALWRALGDAEQARRQDAAADALRARFEQKFWCEELGTYALALDGDKRPCRVKNSNAGHALFTGIASQTSARALETTLLAPDMFSGWGIRTLGQGAVRFNPISYHNGSIWPHDNALIASGLARYGASASASQIVSGMFDASSCFEISRLPELFCGFERVEGNAPTLYPVACSPQSWSAASAFLLLQAALGMAIDAPARELRFVRPALPPFLEHLTLRGLRVGSAVADVRIERSDRSTSVGVLRCDGVLKVLVEI